MRRVDVPPKRCEYRRCRAWMFRKKRAYGLESVEAFSLRRFCDKTCSALERAIVNARRKACEQCGSTLKRKRCSTGKIECRGSFRRRRYCDEECLRLWRDEHAFEYSQQRRDAALKGWSERRSR